MNGNDYGLKPKQLAFADTYLSNGLNAREAYMAVYAPVKDTGADASASRLLKNAKVQAYVDMRLEEISNAQIAKAEEIFKFWTTCMRGELEEEMIVLQPSDIPGVMENVIMKKQISAKDRLKSSENLAKALGMMKEKTELEVTERIVIVDDL